MANAPRESHKMKPKYAAFSALDPFFEVVQRGLSVDRRLLEPNGGTAHRDVQSAQHLQLGAPVAGLIQGGRITDTNFSSGVFGRVTSMAGTPRASCSSE
jgi:hypothetical protein